MIQNLTFVKSASIDKTINDNIIISFGFSLGAEETESQVNGQALGHSSILAGKIGKLRV